MTEPIVLERTLPAPPEEVFAAWSSAESMREWMVPGDLRSASVELDFRVGGRFRLVMHGESDFEHSGEFLEIDPPERIVMTWVSEWMPEDERRTRVSVSFEPEGDDATRLRLVHDELPDTDRYEGHREGWAVIVDKLAREVDG